MKRKEKEKLEQQRKNRVVAQHMKLIASNIRHMEMHLSLIFPNIEDANIQGSVRDCYNSIARSLVEMAQTIEK